MRSVIGRSAAVLALAVCALSSCITHPSREELARGDFVKAGTIGERAFVSDTVHRVTPAMQHALTEVYVSDDCPRYKRDQSGDWLESGHCEWMGRTICIHPCYLDDETVWHEIAHAFFYALPAYKRADWEAISKPAYGGRSGMFPRNGIITNYGATNYYENFAEWVAWALERCTSGGRAWDVDVNLINKRDVRFLRSLQFLRDCGALSVGDYATLEPLFTPVP